MPQHHDVQSFIDQAQRVTRPEELYALMQDITREMGFDHFALVHHVDISPEDGLRGVLVTRDCIALNDYPEAWVREYLRDRVLRDDPVLLAAQQTTVGFAWDRVDQLVRVTSAHRALTERTRKAGIADGFSVPANLLGGPAGSCNFAVGRGREAPRQNFLMAQLVGVFAFEAGLALARRMFDAPPERPRLSPRLRECIALAAQGKSDWEIARILGLREATVTTYMQRARERYGVSTRMQVVLTALYDGEIGFSDIR